MTCATCKHSKEVKYKDDVIGYNCRLQKEWLILVKCNIGKWVKR